MSIERPWTFNSGDASSPDDFQWLLQLDPAEVPGEHEPPTDRMHAARSARTYLRRTVETKKPDVGSTPYRKHSLLHRGAARGAVRSSILSNPLRGSSESEAYCASSSTSASTPDGASAQLRRLTIFRGATAPRPALPSATTAEGSRPPRPHAQPHPPGTFVTLASRSGNTLRRRFVAGYALACTFGASPRTMSTSRNYLLERKQQRAMTRRLTSADWQIQLQSRAPPPSSHRAPRQHGAPKEA